MQALSFLLICPLSKMSINLFAFLYNYRPKSQTHIPSIVSQRSSSQENTRIVKLARSNNFAPLHGKTLAKRRFDDRPNAAFTHRVQRSQMCPVAVQYS